MKRLLTWVVVILMAVSLSACMTTTKAPATAAAPAHVKCPNCGFEFDLGHP